jgi:two-component system sensor histidine kinase AtoS
MNERVLLSVRNLGVVSNRKQILNHVNLTINRGEIHALAGDQSSGKNALAEVLSGLNLRYTGRIFFADRQITRFSARKALEVGIETIHSIPRILPHLTVLENIFPLRRVGTNRAFLNTSPLAELARAKIRLFSNDIDLLSPVDQCGDEEKVVLCLARSLCRSSQLLIVNDISSRLTRPQVDVLHRELSALRSRGTAVLYVTSNIEEVYNFADRISLFHQGKLAITQKASHLNKLDLVQLSVSNLYPSKEFSRKNFELFYLSNFYENIINSMPIPMLIITTQENIASINDSFAMHFGISKESYLNANICALFPWNSRKLADFGARSSLSDGTITRIRKMKLLIDDRPSTADLSIIPIYDEDNSFLGSMLLFDKSRVDIGFEKYYQLTSANKTIPFFAHEIRNPLAIINNLLKLIRQISRSPEIDEYLSKSENEIKRIKAIVNDLMSQRNAKEKPFPRRDVDLGALIEEVISAFSPSCSRNGIVLTQSTARGMSLHYDASKLREVLVNLVLNAIEAVSKDGTIVVEAGYAADRKKKGVVIRVIDDGVGIDSDQMRRIFEPFFTTKRGKERRGLGLSICKDIVTSWGGSISVRSKVNQGSTFSISLPGERPVDAGSVRGDDPGPPQSRRDPSRASRH